MQRIVISSDSPDMQIDDAQQTSGDEALVAPASFSTQLGNKRASAPPSQGKKKRKSL
jgi:hypothetical protein